MSNNYERVTGVNHNLFKNRCRPDSDKDHWFNIIVFGVCWLCGKNVEQKNMKNEKKMMCNTCKNKAGECICAESGHDAELVEAEANHDCKLDSKGYCDVCAILHPEKVR